MSKFFTSYLSVGLLTAALAAACFIKLNVVAFSLLGLTVGIATRSPRRCCIGFITSLGLAVIPALLTFYSDSPIPPAFDWFWGVYLSALWGALLGAALQLPASRLLITSLCSSFVSLIVLIGIAIIARSHFPLEWRVLERWEYATIILAVPIIGAGVWWPVDVMDKAQHQAKGEQDLHTATD